jgi:hypothetical protein
MFATNAVAKRSARFFLSGSDIGAVDISNEPITKVG